MWTFAKKKPDHAFKVNTFGTEHMVKACKEFDSGLLYISTGAVFDGKKEIPYIENDDPDPLSIYGKSKLEGEKAVIGVLDKYFIMRAGWMVGGWELDKKFVYKIVQQIKEGKKELVVVSDKFGSPTFTKDFASNLLNVIENGEYGLYHMANKGSCSRHEMAMKIVEYMGLSGKVKVNPVTSDKFPLPAPRPRSAVMENQKLNTLGLNNMPFWETSLEAYIKENKDKG